MDTAVDGIQQCGIMGHPSKRASKQASKRASLVVTWVPLCPPRHSRPARMSPHSPHSSHMRWPYAGWSYVYMELGVLAAYITYLSRYVCMCSACVGSLSSLYVLEVIHAARDKFRPLPKLQLSRSRSSRRSVLSFSSLLVCPSLLPCALVCISNVGVVVPP